MKKLFLFLFLFLFLDFLFTKFFYLKKIENKKIHISHDVFHHHLKSNHTEKRNDGKRYGEWIITTNSLGFRDSKIRNIDLKNKNRLVLIGDSFIEGILINYEYTVAGLLQKYFNKQNIEVLNMGVSSYSPIIYLEKVKYYLENGLEFSHLVVFIDMSDIIDEVDEYKYDEKKQSIISVQPIGKKKEISPLKYRFTYFLKNNLIINFKILKFIDNKFIYPLVKISPKEFIDEYLKNEKYIKGKWTIDYRIKEKYNEGIKKSESSIISLKKLLDENNIKLTIAVYPYFTQIYHHDLDSLHVKNWETFARQNNIQFINFFPAFINKENKNKNIYEVIQEDFINYDVHWNKNGSKKVADYFIKNFIF